MSLTGQLFVLVFAALLPLIFTEQLTPLKLVRAYIAPSLPAPVPVAHPSPRATSNAPSTPSHVFTAPMTIPNRVVTSDAPAPPEIGVPNAPPNSAAFAPLDGPLRDLIRTTTPPVAAPKPAPKPAEVLPSNRVQVGGDVQAAKLLKKLVPGYPPLARQARVSGTVRLIGVIGKDGTIQNLQLISGHPLLTQSALDAVSKWIYRPTLLNGQPVEVISPIEVVFTLNQ